MAKAPIPAAAVPCRLYPENGAIEHHSLSSSLHSKQRVVTVSHQLSVLPLQHSMERWAVEGTGAAGSVFQGLLRG